MVEEELFFSAEVVAHELGGEMAVQGTGDISVYFNFSLFEPKLKVMEKCFQVVWELGQIIESLISASFIIKDGNDVFPIYSSSRASSILQNSLSLLKINNCLLKFIMTDFFYPLTIVPL